MRNYLPAHREVDRLSFPAVSSMERIACSAFPVNAPDALWRKYGIGEPWEGKHLDGETVKASKDREPRRQNETLSQL